jgi:hypothetical protein
MSGAGNVISVVARCGFVAAAILIGFYASAASANEEDKATLARYAPQGPHRFDFSFTRVDTIEADVDVFLFGYTRAVGSHILVGVTGGAARLTAPADPAAGQNQEIDELALTDTLVSFQFDQGKRLTASPWVPDTVGLNAALLVPTGDADEGIGSDFWFGSVGAGWLVDAISHLWLVPAIGYESTFAEGDLAVPTEGVYVSCDITWVFPLGVWIGYSPSIGRELESDEWVDAHTLTVGKLWQKGFGLSFEVGKNDRIGPIPARDDETWFVNLYYQF